MAELTIGDVTAVVSYVPNRQARYFGYSQQIYLQSQIDVGNITISAVYFYWEGGTTQATRTIHLYMNHTSKTSFSGTTDWTEKATLNEVYAGNYVSTNAEGWIGVTLDTPFVYNNTDNIVVSMHDDTGSGDDAGRHYGTASVDNTSIYYQNNTINPDPTNPPTGFVALYKPDMKIVYETTVTGLPIWVNVNGVWKQVTDVSVNKEGTWKTVSSVNVDVAGTWKTVV